MRGLDRADQGVRAAADRRAAGRMAGLSAARPNGARCWSPASAVPAGPLSRDTSRIPSDQVVIVEGDVRAVVQSVSDGPPLRKDPHPRLRGWRSTSSRRLRPQPQGAPRPPDPGSAASRP